MLSSHLNPTFFTYLILSHVQTNETTMATHRHRLQESRSRCSYFTSLRQFLFWVCSCNTITSSDVIAVRQILGQQSRWDTVQQNKHPEDVCIPLQRTPTSWMEWKKKTQSQDQTGDNKRIEISLILDLYTHCNLIKLVLIEGCIHLRCCNFLIYLCAPESEYRIVFNSHVTDSF